MTARKHTLTFPADPSLYSASGGFDFAVLAYRTQLAATMDGLDMREWDVEDLTFEVQCKTTEPDAGIGEPRLFAVLTMKQRDEPEERAPVFLIHDTPQTP